MPTSLHLYVPNADEVYASAVAAGATSVSAPVDQFYGDRKATVQDLAANYWYIATHKATGHMPPAMRSITPFLHTRGADAFIEFAKRGLGAEEVSVFRSPEGQIAHAVIRIGDSMIELSEAHGQWQPMPTMFFTYVENADAAYERAIAAGATSLSAPSDQQFGDRMGAITDPFGNQWYLATPK
jgi:PhnB protein